MHNTRVLPHVHTLNTDEQESGDDVALALPVAEGADGEAIPTNAWACRHGSDFTGERIPFGCGVYLKPAAT